MKITLHEIDRTHSSVRFRVENDERPEEWAYKASNGIELMCVGYPRWYTGMRRMYLQAECTSGDNDICKATPAEYKEIQAAVAESNAVNATHEPEPDRVAVLTERVAQLESRLAALESADDPVQDDAGSDDVPQPDPVVMDEAKAAYAAGKWEPVEDLIAPKQPRFTRDGNRVIDNELHRQTWFAAEDIAEDARRDFATGASCTGIVSWDEIAPESVPEQPKRRRVWCNQYSTGKLGPAYLSRAEAIQMGRPANRLGQVEFIEILPGDGDVFAERDVLREQMERFAQNKDLGNNPARIARLTLERADKAKEASDDN